MDAQELRTRYVMEIRHRDWAKVDKLIEEMAVLLEKQQQEKEKKTS